MIEGAKSENWRNGGIVEVESMTGSSSVLFVAILYHIIALMNWKNCNICETEVRLEIQMHYVIMLVLRRVAIFYHV